MSATTAIEWTDATWNPVRGCRKVSPGCKHCYAETFAERFRGVPGHVYERGFDPRLAPDMLAAPLRWVKPRLVFVNSMSDLFLEDLSDDYIVDVARVMEMANWQYPLHHPRTPQRDCDWPVCAAWPMTKRGTLALRSGRRAG